MPDDGRAADTLWNRTYIGLLIAQFLAAFNDQAIHSSAMFFAINTQALTEKQAISLMPMLFYLPWTLFVTLAGYYADRYSKRDTLVFWKFSEIAIAGIALLGFYLGTVGNQPRTGAWIVLATVFLMGMHAAFFGPAKYGVMPEILKPELLSRGNGLLESLSFTAVILGTVTGGVLSYVFQRQEWIIGVILVGLALIGSVASLMIRRMPAANKDLEFPPYIYGPLWTNLKIVGASRPLLFAFAGIAFFTFVVAFMRMTVYMLGESQNPRWDELKTSGVAGTVAFGIGLGSPLAGWLSGKKVELGLIPLGALGMILGCILAATVGDSIEGLIASTVLIGFSSGFFLVPMFTLLQYRAPKACKGEIVATSNFVDVLGAIVASLLFFVVVTAAERTGIVPTIPGKADFDSGVLERIELDHGRAVHVVVRTVSGPMFEVGKPVDPDASLDLFAHIFNAERVDHPVIHVARGIAEGTNVTLARYQLRGVEHLTIRGQDEARRDSYDRQQLPGYLFLGAGLLTILALYVLIRVVPDLTRRTGLFLKGLLRPAIAYEGLESVPGTGPIIFLLQSDDADLRNALVRGVDRYILPVAPSELKRAGEALAAGHGISLIDSEKARTALRALGQDSDSLQTFRVDASRSPSALVCRIGPLS